MVPCGSIGEAGHVGFKMDGVGGIWNGRTVFSKPRKDIVRGVQ